MLSKFYRVGRAMEREAVLERVHSSESNNHLLKARPVGILVDVGCYPGKERKNLTSWHGVGVEKHNTAVVARQVEQMHGVKNASQILPNPVPKIEIGCVHQHCIVRDICCKSRIFRYERVKHERRRKLDFVVSYFDVGKVQKVLKICKIVRNVHHQILILKANIA